ncbi:helix-turn-helix domain-containing protein [Rothia nasimurium]|uniref:helix-turn-helix domain-containing protein n=1 Tax=Rothia nasimurium TaxID=85336 RepID=UPI001F282D57|nr:helix-turn-helix transcriptional regulator [Rothia nasimurium]
MTENAKVAESIDQLMYFQGKSTKDLAELLEVSESRASLLRNGKSELKLNQFFIIADWLQVSMNELRAGFQLVPRVA